MKHFFPIKVFHHLCFSGSSSQTRFIQTNKDLLLTVTKEDQIGGDVFIFWKFKNDNHIARLNDNRPFIFPDYDGRVEFLPEDLSLVLKNVQLNDSGIYTAVVSGLQGEFKHMTTVDSVFNSPESCNFTVSCTTELSPSISRSFTCNTKTCEEAHPPTPGPAPSDLTSSVLTSSLQLSLTNERIICNHSNQVSWTQDTKNWREICPISGKEGKVEPFFSSCLTPAVGHFMCIFSTLVFTMRNKKEERHRS
uniref:Immunoglobulin subtype domain-containing protein n=1 Tax=Neogobius melanostomus TaxID=47308 RepID=A0A8C6UI28_9GOBI